MMETVQPMARLPMIIAPTFILSQPNMRQYIMSNESFMIQLQTGYMISNPMSVCTMY